MKKYGPTSEGVQKFLKEVKDFDGVTGKLAFDKTNDCVKSALYILEVKNGKWTKVK
jgi:ABC-type branched-subunit amino acid transport system substrate-binding protein